MPSNPKLDVQLKFFIYVGGVALEVDKDHFKENKDVGTQTTKESSRTQVRTE